MACHLKALWLHRVFFINSFSSAKTLTKQKAISGNKVTVDKDIEMYIGTWVAVGCYSRVEVYGEFVKLEKDYV